MEEIVYENVRYKGEPGTLTVNDKVFHYQSDTSKTSVKCSWARVDKRQLSPESASTQMIKLILVSGKTAVFSVKDRATLEEMRHDMQQRMDAAKMRASTKGGDVRQSQRQVEDTMDRSHTTRKSQAGVVWQDEPSTRRGSTTTNQKFTETTRQEEEKRGGGDACGWCLCGSLVCWLLLCCICILLVVAVALVYWFVLKDSDNDPLQAVGITPKKNESFPPDHGKEQRYGIRAVNHEWNQEEVKLLYQLSDYILDDSVSYILYDGLGCRTDANDITRSNQYLFMEFSPPKGQEPDLYNKGAGTRGPFELHFTLNKAGITNAPFYTPVGLDRAQLNFCIGLSIDYNQVDYWSREQEVNAVETAIQMDIDMSDFRRIDNFAIKTIIRPKYNRRRHLLRAAGGGEDTSIIVQEKQGGEEN